MNYMYFDYKMSEKVKKEQFEICYIVNKDYINKLKNIFKYREFCLFIIKEKFDKYRKSINNFNELLNKKTCYDEIKNEASHIKFTGINKHIIRELKENDNLTYINKKFLKDNKELYYYNNFEIISNDLYLLLNNQNISLNEEKMIKTKCLFIENKIIFYNNESNKNFLIVSNINFNYEFVCDFIFYYNKENYLKTHITEIQKNGLENAILNLNFINNEAYIFNYTFNGVIGKVYKIIREISDSDLSKEIKEEIFILIKIYLFNKDLKINVDISMNKVGAKNYDKYIYKEKCYLINNEWMDEYKKYYLYDELFNYLEKEEIKKKLDIHHYNKKYYNESNKNIKIIYEEIKNNANFFKKYYNKEIKKIDEKLLELKEANSGIIDKNNKEIKYFDEFSLMNLELKKDIIVNKYKKGIFENEYIINQGKLIICLKNYPFNKILIGSLNNENQFFLLAFIIFVDCNELKSSFSKLMYLEFSEFLMKLNNNKIYNTDKTKEVGELIYIDDNKKENIEINFSKKKDYIKLLIELYYVFDTLNFHIKDENKNFCSQENYYLINKELINYLNKCYNYEQITKIINECDKNKKFIKKYRENIEIVIDSKDINNIISKIPEEIKNDIKNKDKSYDINTFKSFEKMVEEKNKEIYYYNECLIINHSVKNILVKIVEINYEFDNVVNCFISKHNVYLCYKLKNNLLISIGKLDENNILKINILITLDNYSDYLSYFNEIIIKGRIPKFIKELKKETQKVKILYNSDNKKYGYAFLFNNYYNNCSDKKEEKQYIENKNKIQIQNNKNQEALEKLLKEDLKSLMKFYLFNKKLIEHLEPSKCIYEGIFFDNTTKYYLISDKFMNKFINLYQLKELIPFFNNKLNNDLSNNIYSIINRIFNGFSETDIYENFINKISVGDLNYSNFEENILDIDYDIIKNGNINLLSFKNFEIIDDCFYNFFILKKNIKHIDKILSVNVDINNGKIIITFLEKDINSINNRIILIGNIKVINNNFNYKFILDVLIYCSDSGNRQQISNAFRNYNYINVLKNVNLMKNNFIYYFYESLKQNTLIQIPKNNFIQNPNSEQNNDNTKKKIKNIDNKDNVKNNINQKTKIVNQKVFNFKKTNIKKNIGINENIADIKTYNYGKNMIKIIIFLYLQYEEMNEIIKNEIKYNLNEKYCIINKEFMRIYKDYYDYQKIIDILRKDSNVETEFFKHKKTIDFFIKNEIDYEKYISIIIGKFKDININELGKKRENQKSLIELLCNNKDIKMLGIQTGRKKTLNYYEDIEITNVKFFELIQKIESEQINKLVNKHEANCIFGENKIFIKMQENNNYYFYFDIGQLYNNIFRTDLIIYYYNYKKFNDFINKIKNESFEIFIKPHIKDVQEKNISCISNITNNQIEGKIIKIKDLSLNYNYNINSINNTNEINKIKTIKNTRINKLNDNAKKMLKLILYNNQFINRINQSINECEINFGYLVKYDFINDIYKSNIYKIIFNYVLDNKHIQEILHKNLHNNYNDYYQKILQEFDSEVIDKINKCNEEIKIYSHSYSVELVEIKLNRFIETYIANNFYILNEEIYKLFAMNENCSNKQIIEYFYKEKKIFISLDVNINKKSLLIYYMNIRYELILELILNILKPFNLANFIKQIKAQGYEKFKEYFVFNENEIVSPKFDTNQNLEGNIYKYVPSIIDYTKYNINFEIKKLFLLYLNYKRLMNPSLLKNNNFEEFYLVNKSWILKYKNYYNYFKFSLEVDENKFIQTKLDIEINNSQNNNLIVKDKLIFLLVKQLPKNIINDCNYRNNKLNSLINDEKQNPKLTKINYNENNILLYYYDFELISEAIYDFLFPSMDKKTYFQEVNNKVKCIFDDGYIIIIFTNPNPDGKYLIEIGKIDSHKIFQPEFFLLYNQYYYLNHHTQNVLKLGGFKEFCETFESLPMNTFDILCNKNQKCGIIIKNNNKKSNINSNKYNIKNQFSLDNFLSQQEKFKIMNTFQLIEIQNNNKPFTNKEDDFINIFKDIKKSLIIIHPHNLSKLKTEFQFPPKIGLNKIGDNYYMNAILQCFCQIREFVSYFKYDNHINEAINNYSNKKKDSLTAFFKNIIDKIWPDKNIINKINISNHKVIESTKINMNPILKNKYSGAPKDLINFIIMTLHDELNQDLNDNKKNQIKNDLIKNNSQRKYAFKPFNQEYHRRFNSKINELFCAIKEIKTQCLNCANSFYNFQIYYLLIFPLEDIRKYALNKININDKNNKKCFKNTNQDFARSQKLNNNIINILDCFEYNRRTELLQGENQIFCNICEKMVDANHTSILLTAPKILIILFNRGIILQTQIKIEFYKELNITNYISNNFENNIIYKLIGIITYQGEFEKDGHFIAHCLSPIDNEWYTYNDAIVSKIDDIQKQIIDLGMPYLLFYKKIERNILKRYNTN